MEDQWREGGMEGGRGGCCWCVQGMIQLIGDWKVDRWMEAMATKTAGLETRRVVVGGWVSVCVWWRFALCLCVGCVCV